LMSDQATWTGNATELLRCLAQLTDDATRRSARWPSTPAVLSNRLSRAASFLRKVGIQIESRREGHDRTRIIRLARRPLESGPSADRSSSGPIKDSDGASDPDASGGMESEAGAATGGEHDPERPS
jgi:hypothetical protein